MDHQHFDTPGGFHIEAVAEQIDSSREFDALIDQLDRHVGVVLTSTYEQPGRYTRWDFGFINPPLVVTAKERMVEVAALNERGEVLLAGLRNWLQDADAIKDAVQWGEITSKALSLRIEDDRGSFFEEQRSRRPSVFSLLREIVQCFSCQDSHLGLYGGFGYDLAFQFEPVERHMPRDPRQRDLVLYVPDEIVAVDHRREIAQRIRYEFSIGGASTKGLERVGEVHGFTPAKQAPAGDHQPGEYARVVEQAKKSFARGDLFEVVPGRVFNESVDATPSEMFKRLRSRNPAPFGALMNFGDGEYLISASPEMYVRVENKRVETCPISGTIARGQDVFGDEKAIRELLGSAKEESELTMCTDVDRNDKSRVCKPETIKVIGRRQIEMYSRLIHTVDHVEGELLDDMDGIDAFLAHTWAVTVTGAPKLWAMRFIEENEKSPRAWYGGAIGALLFNGDVNTGLTLRTIWLHDGVASIRAGATLLMDSDPAAEEAETETKASALIDAVRNEVSPSVTSVRVSDVGKSLRILLIDHEDSFVHNLAGYLRRTGADVVTTRVQLGSKFDTSMLERADTSFDLVVLSPGPGKPADFGLTQTVADLRERNMPMFGVCLGLQGIVEAFGGTLRQMDVPQHGKSGRVTTSPSWLLDSLPESFEVGRYHSLCAAAESLPEESGLVVTATTEDGIPMAIEHRDLPIAAVQFHPESLMTLQGDVGFRILESMIKAVRDRRS